MNYVNEWWENVKLTIIWGDAVHIYSTPRVENTINKDLV